MMQLPQRNPYSGAALVRLLARLMQTGVPASEVSLPDRLSQWLGWTDAIALSSALDAAAPAPLAGAQSARGDATVATLEAALCARTRATLTASIDALDAARRGAKGRRNGVSLGARAGAAPMRGNAGSNARIEAGSEAGTAADAAPDFAPFGQRYQAQQQAMESAIGELRSRLRAMLATRGERHARLALVDATMARAVEARERSLLGMVPALLETHFTRLRDTALAAAGAVDAAEVAAVAAVAEPAEPVQTAPPAGAWLDAFCEDMRAVLLAELELRFEPVEGLLAALRAS
ncbi:MAG TPA: DUF3348 family protein [Paraburkholderia sp.]|nr:DUF3348 family protein [Paraburkholderia sp.]